MALINTAMPDNGLYIGLISGTSVDGVDSILVSFEGNKPNILATHFEESSLDLRESVLSLCEGSNISLSRLGQTDVAIGIWFAKAVNKLLESANISADKIRAIGSHGQTIWHHPTGDNAFSLQIGNPNYLAQLTGITTIADFRQRDIAANGQGAPLAPLFHREVFQNKFIDRAIINIGGIANVTILSANGSCFAFDTGPGNVLMDYWIGKNHQQRFDQKGNWAAGGNSDKELLGYLLDDPYFALKPPKSTGRELFSGAWLERKMGKLGKSITAIDVQATLADCTVSSIANALSGICRPQEIFICGGGAHNDLLVDKIAYSAPQAKIATTEKLGIDPDWVEAIAFAWMAKKTLAGEAVDTSPFTGANKPLILGGIYKA